jgi:hypothetical protein
MEAASLKSAAVPDPTPVEAPARPACRLPTQRALLADTHASDVTLPLRFIVLGIPSLVAGLGVLAARPDLLAEYHYNQHIIALTHLVVLGWLASVAMGAIYQLAPVALETRLHSPRLARWHFALHLVGVPGMVWMFWVWDMKQVGHFGSAVALGMFFLVYNLARTLRRAPHRNAVWLGLASALAWLTLTALAGLYVAAAKCWHFTPFSHLSQMHAHAHAGVLGFFVTLLAGVSYKLVPMFALGEIQSERRARTALWLLNAGALAVFVAVLLDAPWKLPAALVAASGLALHAVELIAILRVRKRRKLDPGQKAFLAGCLLLAPTALLGLALSWPGLTLTQFTGQLENAYGLLAVLGALSLAILGMLHKIVPFLVWYRAYGQLLGKSAVPTLAEMFSRKIQVVSLALYAAGLMLATAGTVSAQVGLIRGGGLVMLCGAVAFAANMALVFRHLVRPQLKPLNLPVTPAAKS